MNDEYRNLFDDLPLSEADRGFLNLFWSTESVGKRFVLIRKIFEQQEIRIAKIRQQPAPSDGMQREIDKLRLELDAMKDARHEDETARAEERTQMQTALEKLYDNQRQLSDAIQQLLAQNKTLSDAVTAAKNENAALREENAALRNDIAALQQAVAELQNKPPEVPPVPPSPFELPHDDELLFTDSTAHNRDAFARLRRIEPLMTFLDAHPMKDTHSLQSLLQQYEKKLKKTLDDIDLDDFDPEEWAQTLADAVWDVMKTQFFANGKIMTAIARGLQFSETAAFYESFLPVVNDYLQGLHIYTEPVREGDVFAQQDIEPNKIEAPDAEHAGRIKSVDRLPYYLDYLDDRGDPQRKVADGSAVVWFAE